MIKNIVELLLEIDKTNISAICININEYIYLMNNTDLDVVTVRHILQTGHYANIYGLKCYVSNKTVDPNFIKFSNKENQSPKEDKDWTPIVPIECAHQIDRALKLKAFW